MITPTRSLLVYLIAIEIASTLAIPLRSLGQGAPSKAQHHHYKLIDLGTFGGPSSTVGSEPFGLISNNSGMVVGGADTPLMTPEPACYNPVLNPDCYISHPFVWKRGRLEDLGTLRGANFSFAGAINQTGQIVGLSETNQTDPTTGNPEFHAVLWQDGFIRDLGTLGGVSSFASSLNGFGQVTGVALNSVPDTYSILGNGSGTTLTQTRGFFWKNGKMQDLGTLGGPDTWAMFIDDRGQIAGTSFTSDVVDPLSGSLPIGVFLWENGRMKNIGDLGGDNSLQAPWEIVVGLNNSGQIAGTMLEPGNQDYGAFLWDGEKLKDLGTLGGTSSLAGGINDAGQVVGLSVPPGNNVVVAFLWNQGKMISLGTTGEYECSGALGINLKNQIVGALTSLVDGCNEWRAAFLWENGGPMIDLNTLIPPNSGVQLVSADRITDNGEIVASGMPTSCTDTDSCPYNHVFVLVPCDENHPGIDGCDYGMVESSAVESSHPPSAKQGILPLGEIWRKHHKSPLTSNRNLP